MNNLNRKTLTIIAATLFALTGTKAMAHTVEAVQSMDPASQTPPTTLRVACVQPFTTNAECNQVIDTLKTIVAALNSGDLNTYAQYLDDECTTFDDGRLIVGKDALIDQVKTKLAKRDKHGVKPVISYTIDHPFARVNGDVAVVSFGAVREIGGKHHTKEVCQATDVFVKEGDTWKRLHFRARWHKMS